jgi:hypothetical protein
VSLADADSSLKLNETEEKQIFDCKISYDGKVWSSGLLKDAPTTLADFTELWEKLKTREAELPEKPEGEEEEEEEEKK